MNFVIDNEIIHINDNVVKIYNDAGQSLKKTNDITLKRYITFAKRLNKPISEYIEKLLLEDAAACLAVSTMTEEDIKNLGAIPDD